MTLALEGMDRSNPIKYDRLHNGLFQGQNWYSYLELDRATLTNPEDWLKQEWPASASDLSAKAPAPKCALSASEERTTSDGEELAR